MKSVADVVIQEVSCQESNDNMPAFILRNLSAVLGFQRRCLLALLLAAPENQSSDSIRRRMTFKRIKAGATLFRPA